MIARIWFGKTKDSASDEYFDYLEKTGIKDSSSTEGNRGVYVLRRVEDGISEFLFITLWDSFEDIKKFAGQDIEKAVYYPDDKKYLLELEPHVKHFEVLLASKDGNSYNEGSISRLVKYTRGIKI
ncbi:MAG: antibiotic biosynthesis monooxygenase [Candidatus Aminicenantes bacterium]|nr:MAG: antibiotic biosynthesis monooxygenase [Candidatus Aminicenantes bacterium]